MFPESFAEHHIARWSNPGDLVLDPFSGRGTAAMQALLMDRDAAAIDVNPVAYCVSAAKCDPSPLDSVKSRIDEIELSFGKTDPTVLREERRALPAFFGRAFHRDTLDQILWMRRSLNWLGNPVDRFVAALVLGTLHGEMGRSARYLSNQMPRTISTKPAYSLKYWRGKNLWAIKKDAWTLLRAEADYRLVGPLPSRRGMIAMGDARRASGLIPSARSRASLVVTSPPYLDVTRFEEDQWLRLWFLGHQPRPTYRSIIVDDRISSKEAYWRFLSECWAGIAPLLAPAAIFVVRIGSGRMNDSELVEGLSSSLTLPERNLTLIEGPTKSKLKRRQTSAFRPGSEGVGHEVDFVFQTVSASAAADAERPRRSTIQLQPLVEPQLRHL